MGSRLILLLGLIAGILLAYYCIINNKDRLIEKQPIISKEVNQTIESNTTTESKPIKKLPSIPEPEPEVETIKKVEKNSTTKMETVSTEPIVIYSEPSFSYRVDETKLTAKLSPKDRTKSLEEFILGYCQTNTCIQDITFDEETKKANWKDSAIKIAAFLRDKNIKDGYISVSGRLFIIDGKLKNIEEMNLLNRLIEPFSPSMFRVENSTTVEEEIDQNIESEKESQEKIKESQNRVNEMLTKAPIYFKINSSTITKKSQKTLDKIIKELSILDDFKLKVEGHTDARGEALLNKKLSQKRADAVKNYLKLNGLDRVDIEAVGYGEELPISDNPRDRINRRVEIHLQKGD